MNKKMILPKTKNKFPQVVSLNGKWDFCYRNADWVKEHFPHDVPDDHECIDTSKSRYFYSDSQCAKKHPKLADGEAFEAVMPVPGLLGQAH